MSNAHKENRRHKTTIAARIPRELKEAVVALADAGNRSTSREIAAAIKEHVDKASPPSTPVAEAPAAPSDRHAAGAPAEAA
jgi:hypothetical protein